MALTNWSISFDIIKTSRSQTVGLMKVCYYVRRSTVAMQQTNWPVVGWDGFLAVGTAEMSSYVFKLVQISSCNRQERSRLTPKDLISCKKKNKLNFEL